MIKKLELNDWGNGLKSSHMLNFVSMNFSQLQKLSITEIPKGECLQFAVLKNLSVTYIRNGKKLLQFVSQNSSVETLKVGLVYFEQVTNNFVDELKSLSNVKHIAFGGNGKALNSIFELMKGINSSDSLKTIEFTLVADEKSVSNSGRKKKFHFPIKNTTKFEVI